MVTIQHAHAFGLVSHRSRIGISHFSLPPDPTLCLNFNHTICSLRTINGRTCGIFQHRNTGDVIRIDIQQLRILFLSGRSEIKTGQVIAFKHITIYYHQRLGITVDRTDSTQTHGRTGPQVTGIEHDIQTCHTTLQSLVDARQAQSFKFFSINSLMSHRHFTFRYGQTTGLYYTFLFHNHFF